MFKFYCGSRSYERQEHCDLSCSVRNYVIWRCCVYGGRYFLFKLVSATHRFPCVFVLVSKLFGAFDTPLRMHSRGISTEDKKVPELQALHNIHV